MRALPRRLCIFCGSSRGRAPRYAAAARSAGELLARRGVGVVYGGGNIGLMAEVADGALEAGGEVVGVIPRALVDRELAHPGLTALHVVDSMHHRKALMAELSDGFIGLPGGLGTLEELFEVLTWLQLGFHDKPCALLNLDGYFDHLLGFLDRAVEDGFVSPANRRLLLDDDDFPSLLERMATLFV
jgi:uncharacterized protein (TIGR00730 family)